ncbi:MAG: GIY-YIG nuclease family protein [Candidatus Marinimicrobia bacterium]|nr:GIY-YIG nuclease family protein [Candidatus Neomarinimicrobiota bacterium]
MTYFVYILKAEIEDWYYIGISANPEARLQAHNTGKVRSTKNRKQYKILLIKEFPD